MKTCPGILLASLLTACGARSAIPVPPVDFVARGPLPAYCLGVEDMSIYVVTAQSELFSFDPLTTEFAPIGTVDCPTTATGATPFSMAADHQGTAYVIFGDGELFAVSAASASCVATSPAIDSSAFTPTFGMGFSSDSGGLGETLFLAGTSSPGHLGTLDTSTFVVQDVGAFSSDIGGAELTGTGDGRLFAFGVVSGMDGAHLAELDKTDASVVSDTIVPTPQDPTDWAFAFWGGDFYFFTSVDGATSQVGRFRPEDGSFDAKYATLPSGAILGAGVSTCAPR